MSHHCQKEPLVGWGLRSTDHAWGALKETRWPCVTLMLISKGKADLILDPEEVVAVSGECARAFHGTHLQAQAAGGQMVVRHSPNHSMEKFRKAELIVILLVRVLTDTTARSTRS